MAFAMNDKVLTEAFGPTEGALKVAKQAALVLLGVVAMGIAAKIRVPMWPVNMTMQTFVVLTVGATYGTRLSIVTLLAYLAVGALGFAVFTGDGAGLAYFAGPTAGYLVGFLVAAGVVGALARRGWDRSTGKMVGALLIGNAIIYLCGMPWMAYLFLADKGAAWVFQWGMGNFLVGDAVKLMLAALIVPTLWKLVPRG